MILNPVGCCDYHDEPPIILWIIFLHLPPSAFIHCQHFTCIVNFGRIKSRTWSVHLRCSHPLFSCQTFRITISLFSHYIFFYPLRDSLICNFSFHRIFFKACASNRNLKACIFFFVFFLINSLRLANMKKWNQNFSFLRYFQMFRIIVYLYTVIWFIFIILI